MEEAKASWNTQYISKEGFECQLTLRDDDDENTSAEEKLAKRASVVMFSLTNSGCLPIRRYTSSTNGDGEQPPDDDKVYFDAEGVRRCNKKVKDGKTCGSLVSSRKGEYGVFWGCPNHAAHIKKQT